MKIGEAKNLLGVALSFDIYISQMDNLISNISDQDEKAIWVSRLGVVMGAIYGELVIPIFKQYPELDQDSVQ